MNQSLGGISGSRKPSRKCVSALTGFDPGRMGGSSTDKYDPAYEAAFMLPRLNDAQREFIVRAKPTKANQRITKRDFDAVWPGVETGHEWPWMLWFGETRANFPAGRSPLGKRRCSYAFMFNDAGLLIRAAIAMAPKAETACPAPVPKDCQARPEGIAR